MKRTKRREREQRPMWADDFNARVRIWRWLVEAVDTAVTKWINRPRIGDTRPGSKIVSFKPRDHFRADGIPKRKRTLADAQMFCQERTGYRFYQCSVCQAWHVGHKVTSSRRRYRKAS